MRNIITISREFGSGGREVGRLVAEKLGFAFYNKELIELTAQESGFSKDFISNNEQKLSSNWFYSLLQGAGFSNPGIANINAVASGVNSLPLPDQIYNAQRKVIIDIAKKGPCVIVGRCSDYILKHCEEINKDDVLNVFVYAKDADKIKWAIEKENVPEEQAERTVKLINKQRANHYNTFTEHTWGNRQHYDVMINRSILSLEDSANLIIDIAKKV